MFLYLDTQTSLSEMQRQEIQEQNTNLFLTCFSCNSFLCLLSIVLMGISRMYGAHFGASGLFVQEIWLKQTETDNTEKR